MENVSKEKRANKQGVAESADPVHTVREGAIGASIWLRHSPSGFAYFDFTVSRSWQSKSTGKTGYSKGFFDKNEKELVSVIQKASAWIREKQVELPGAQVGESQAA